MPATSLTTVEFFSRVYALSPRTAIFDCDGTLWSGDAGSGFMRWSIEAGLLSSERTAWLSERYAAYNAGQVSELAICGEMVQAYRGLREEQMREAAAVFFKKHIEAKIFPSMAKLVMELQAKGVDIWAVSSTCDWVIEEGVRRVNIPASRVLAARVAVDDGLVTERLLDVPTDEGKVVALTCAGVSTPDVVFGNSVHDAAMLALARAGGAFPVNPTPALAQSAASAGWPVYFPAETGN